MTSSIIPNPSRRQGPRVLGIIPARLASTRLPRKVLREIACRPLLAWIVDAARRCPELDDLIVAVDSPEVEALCHRNGWPCEMTSPELASGTDRVCVVAMGHAADIIVNIQGDEPLLRPEHITALLRPFAGDLAHTEPPSAHIDVSTLCVPCTPENLDNPNAVKVVRARDGRALYFSRATVPFHRDPESNPAPQRWKHLGLYAYRREALARIAALPPSPLELAERLEQLRWLENGLTVHVESVTHDTVGVDTETDLQTVAALLLAQSPSPPSLAPERDRA